MANQRIEPGPGEESVWDYPRPPALEQTDDHVVVSFDGHVVAYSSAPYRVLETSHPPVYYIDPADINMNLLGITDRSSFCEWKGEASYYSLLTADGTVSDAGWFYESPNARFAAIAGFVAFYPSKVECSVNGELVVAQEGDFYGGWITSKVVGPFKGGAGTWGW